MSIPRLIIESVQPPRTVALTGRQRYVIGRSREAELSLNDPAMSRRHCVVIVTPDGVEVEDLGSSGGTFINGQSIVGAVRLQPGDQIKAGDTVLTFADGTGRKMPTPPPASPDKTVVRRSGSTPAQSTTYTPAPSGIPLGDRLVIGRSPKCDVVLDSREVSCQHAEIRRDPDGSYRVRDLMSTNGSFTNSTEIRGWVTFADGQRLRIGPYMLELRNGQLSSSNQKGNVRITLMNVMGKTVTDKETRQRRPLLDDISLVIAPREFVAFLGPSGCGKSTLIKAINGQQPAESGRVMMGNDDFYACYGQYRGEIGYVPQQDIVHTALTVEQAFRFAALLRLPSDMPSVERTRIVDEVIRKMGLEHRRNELIKKLSGGQLKRVSLGSELIADPSLLFLDEATTGLDAGTEEEMMKLFRHIADDGKTVVCVTHSLDRVYLCDLVVVLYQGKLAYYGKPGQELMDYFGIDKLSEVYGALTTKSADHWQQRYRSSEYCQRYIQDRLPAVNAPASVTTAPGQRATVPKCKSRETIRQWWVLTLRYGTLMLQDWKNLALLMSLAPVIAVLMGLVFGGDRSAPWIKRAPTQQIIVFSLAISAIFFGCINAAKEIVKELDVYRRERAVVLRLPAYLGSKIAVLAVVCFLQCVGLFVVAAPLTGLEGAAFRIVTTLTLTNLCGVLMGLFVSALVESADAALIIALVFAVPQIFFAGAIMQLSGVAEWIGKGLMAAYWSYNALLHTLSAPATAILNPTGSWAKNIFWLVVFLILWTLAALAALRLKDPLAALRRKGRV